MLREELSDLAVFVAVAEARSFTKAAANLGCSQSSLSHVIRRLESRLGLRLLTRTTRNVSCTDAGERLLATLSPAFNTIEADLAMLTATRDRPAGKIRLTTSMHATETVVWPAVERMLINYPDIQIDLSVDPAMRDIVAERYDAGVRFGDMVPNDMIAVRIGPDLKFRVVGSAAYLAAHPAPQIPSDLASHACINLRRVSQGGFQLWHFAKGRERINMRVDGPLIVNEVPMALRAALAGVGLAFMMEDRARPYIEDGRLVSVLEDWCAPFPGYHLFYPSRRELSSPLSVLVEMLRYRA